MKEERKLGMEGFLRRSILASSSPEFPSSKCTQTLLMWLSNKLGREGKRKGEQKDGEDANVLC